MLCLCLLPACGDSNGDEPDNPNPVNPDKEVADPAGTVKLSMRSEAAAGDNKTILDDGLYIDGADNFDTSMWGYIVDLGSMKGLGNVGYIPKTGYAEKVAVIPGHGYIWKREVKGTYGAEEPYFYVRIYVTNYTKNAAGEIIGADIKYQKYFYGKDETLMPKITKDLTRYSYTYSNKTYYYSAKIEIENNTIIPFEVEVSNSKGIPASAKVSTGKGRTYDYAYVNIDNLNGSILGAEASVTLTIKTFYGKASTITLHPKDQSDDE